MPVIPKSDGKGYPALVYLAWHTKLAGDRVKRTLAQAIADTGHGLGGSFAYLTQCKAAEQSGPKKTPASGYRLAEITDLDKFLAQLAAKDVATALGIPEARVLGWKVEGANVARTTRTRSSRRLTATEAAAIDAAPIPPAPVPALPVGVTLDQIQAALGQTLAPLVADLAAVRAELASVRQELAAVKALPRTTGGSAGLENALLATVNLLRDQPQKIIEEQSKRIVATLQEEGKYHSKGLRTLRESLEAQNREIVSVLATVADSLTKLLANKDSTVTSLVASLRDALSLVPEDVEEQKPLTLPLAAVTGRQEAGQQVVAVVPGNGGGK